MLPGAIFGDVTVRWHTRKPESRAPWCPFQCGFMQQDRPDSQPLLHLWWHKNCGPFWKGRCDRLHIWISTAFPRDLLCCVGCLAAAGRAWEQQPRGQRQGGQEWNTRRALFSVASPHTTWVAGHSLKLPPCVLRTDSNCLWRSLYVNITKQNQRTCNWMRNCGVQVTARPEVP